MIQITFIIRKLEIIFTTKISRILHVEIFLGLKYPKFVEFLKSTAAVKIHNQYNTGVHFIKVKCRNIGV